MKFTSSLLAFALASVVSAHAADPIIVKLWPKGAEEPAGFKAEPEKSEKKQDGIERTSHVSDPTITVYRPEKPNGTAVLVCPGGGYNILASEHEGTMVCDFFVKKGVTAILLKYRVPRRDPQDPSKYPLQDAQRAMGIIRHRAAEWSINPERIGILGFSAGGHLTVMTTLHPNERTYTQDPALDKEDVTPNFSIPVYPAYLVTKEETFKLLPEIAVTKKSPPMCLIHAHDDKGATSASASALLYLEYKKLDLPAELHIYTKGGHGFGMKTKNEPVDQWLVRVGEWMTSMGWMGEKESTQK
ncbi:acetyl esterase/lipase [Roseimicrobium gellanilyticum]|uniref:Acetyl esterase/lipase n=1 Tax=Roseimicrobium gellanilyticum TaxID=748857 RepID=A0A366HMC5_9BACT|nr:alpha/beta hydrolase [Roseimicrobium gellanilyticum]RBP44298.1 acetyl esterase/lipase [Roseimicrobium gellanilyticum]